jgi:tryptophan synthase beta subunit
MKLLFENIRKTPAENTNMKHNGRFGPFGGFYVPEVLSGAGGNRTGFTGFATTRNSRPSWMNFIPLRGQAVATVLAKRFSDYVGFGVYIKRGPAAWRSA